MQIIALTLSIFIFACASQAQTKIEATIRGAVTDATTGMPIDNANVFLSGSTYGAGSDSDGRYGFKVFQMGTFQLVFSRVGYDVEVIEVRIARSDSLLCNVSLRPKIIAFNEVEVSTEAATLWHQNYQEFLRYFLGTGPNASQCEIKNPDILDFTSDARSGLLEAKATGPILIVNKALGYELNVSLLEFQWSPRLDYGHFLVYASFRTIANSNPDDLHVWEHNRKRTYDGSLRHFLRSVVDGRIGANGFVMHRGDLADLRREQGRFVFEEEIRTEPVEASSQRRWMCDPWMSVDRAMGEGESESYISTGRQGALIDPAGNLEDPRSVNLLGRWSRERIADMLPLDYGGTGGKETLVK